MSILLRSLFCIAALTLVTGNDDVAKIGKDASTAAKAGATSAYALLCEGREAKCLAKAAEIAASLDRQGGSGARSILDQATGKIRLPTSQDTLTRADRDPSYRAP